MQKYKKYIPGSLFFWGLVIGILFTTTTIFTVLPGYKIFPEMPNKQQLLSGDILTLDDTAKAMQEIYNQISLQYYDAGVINQTKMSRQALSAFVDALGDPFSSYLPPVEGKELNDAIDGNESIDGIGAILSKKDGGALIEEILKSSPSAQSDIKPLDMIIKVNGSGLENLSIGDIVQKIRGPKGTVVNLTIARTSSGMIEIFEKNVIRDTIVIPSVTSKIFTGSSKQSLGYIALSLFAQDTDERFQKEIETLRKQGIFGLILDLRGNGGGLLPEAVDVASHFLRGGIDVVKVKYRLYTDTTYKAEGNDNMSDIPLIILVDGWTASASEIITLAIKEGRCKKDKPQNISTGCDVIVLGEKTFGKGSIQNLQELSFGGSIKLTVGKRFSPSGLSVDYTGIEPDIFIPFDKNRYQKNSFDNQLEKAKLILSQSYK